MVRCAHKIEKLCIYILTFLENRISFPHKCIFLTFTCFYFYLYGKGLFSSIGNIWIYMNILNTLCLILYAFYIYIPYGKHDLWILKYYNFNRISFCKLLHSFTYNAQCIQQNIVTCNHNLSNKWGMVSKWFYVHVI